MAGCLAAPRWHAWSRQVFWGPRPRVPIPVFAEQMNVAPEKQWKVVPVLEALKQTAQAAGLWNLFLPPSPAHDTPEYKGAGLTNLEYALCAEEMGKVSFGRGVQLLGTRHRQYGGPDRYGTERRKHQWLKPLMDGKIRSAFLMTEPDIASSDATNIETAIRRDGEHYVVSGRKWWSSGVGDPRCKIAIVMGKTDRNAERHRQQSQILVPLDSKGIKVVRMLPVFGFDDSPHGHVEVILDEVRVPADNLLLGEGRCFAIAQGRLGPGRIHHCMRTIGVAEAALEKMVRRLQSMSFGKRIPEQSVWEQRIAEARIDIEMTRLLCLKAADMMDRVGNKVARLEIAMIKVQAPRMALRIIDDAIQAHGGGGVTTAFGLAKNYAAIRTLRLADGPDEVHCRAIAKMEMQRHSNA
jgi:acyl-CoA dehydrogenase